MDLTIPATFENGQTELTVPGEGSYVLNPDGSVTFTPEAGFLGQASGVTVVRVDRNERKVTAQYVPTVVPVPVSQKCKHKGSYQQRVKPQTIASSQAWP